MKKGMFDGGGPKSPIYCWGQSTCGKTPPRASSYPKDKMTKMHPADKGKPSGTWTDKTPAKGGASGMGKKGMGKGRTAYPGKNVTRKEKDFQLGVARQTPYRSEFAKKASSVGSGYHGKMSKKGMGYI